MSATKRIDSDYNIEADGAINIVSTTSGTITIGVANDPVSIPGNLTVTGTLTAVDATNLEIQDNTILLNAGEGGAGVTLGTAGIEIDRGSSDNAFLIFDESDDTWYVDFGDGAGAVNAIVTSTGGGTPMNDLIDDLTPQLGGNLDTRGLVIETSNLSGSTPIAITMPVGNTNNIELTVSNASSNIILTASGLNGEIILAGPVLLQGGAPNTAPAGTEAALFKGSDTGGGTQVHYQNDTDTGELVSKSKAIMYSLIF